MSIRDSGYMVGTRLGRCYFEIDESNVFESIMPVVMDDIRVPAMGGWLYPEDGRVPPSRETIGAALDWARDKRNVIVHCTAGVSRSSAMAILIDYERDRDIKRVLAETVNPDLHSPNPLVLEHGFSILGEPTRMYEVVCHFQLEQSVRKDDKSIVKKDRSITKGSR